MDEANGEGSVGRKKMRGKRGTGAIAEWWWMLRGGLLLMIAACAQGMSSAAAPEPALAPAGEVLQRIEDPSTGDLWVLVRDPVRPAGPGRLVLARQGSRPERPISENSAQPLSEEERPVIHRGDALLVEEHTAVVDVRLEAVAMEPAVRGAPFKARLKIGGKVVRALAVAPGRADFAPQSEGKP